MNNPITVALIVIFILIFLSGGELTVGWILYLIGGIIVIWLLLRAAMKAQERNRNKPS